MCRECVLWLCRAECRAPLRLIPGYTMALVFSVCEQGQLAAVTFLGELLQPTLKQNQAQDSLKSAKCWEVCPAEPCQVI